MSEFQYIGKGLPRTCETDKVTGRAVYIDDLKRPGMYPTPEDLANIERRKAAILEKSAEARAHKRERERKLREKKKVSRAGNINLLHHRQKKRMKK